MVSDTPMIAGRVTAGKSRAMTEGEQIPTATSQKWKRAWPKSQRVGAAQSKTRNCGRAAPTRKAPPRNKKIKPISRRKCWLKGPVDVTPGTAKYQFSGATSMKMPLAPKATPNSTATLSHRDFGLSIPSFARCGATEPIFKADRAEARIVAGGEGLIVHLRAEVAGMDVGDHLARVLVCPQVAPGEFGRAVSVRDRLSRSCRSTGAPSVDVGQRGSHVVGGDGLQKSR